MKDKNDKTIKTNISSLIFFENFSKPKKSNDKEANKIRKRKKKPFRFSQKITLLY